MNLILLERSELDPDGNAMVNDGRADHLLDVLAVVPGQRVRVGIVDGPTGTATVSRIADRAVYVRCVMEGDAPLRPRVDLLLAVPRPKVLRRLWAQLAALGVGHVILTNAERVERFYFDSHVLSESCYRPLLIEGLQQARDTWLPRVSIHKQFRPLVEDQLETLAPSSLRIIMQPGAFRSVSQIAAHHNGRRVLLAVGPEGGWNDFELGLLEQHGFTIAAMGERTLRSDTACVALLALVHDAIR